MLGEQKSQKAYPTFAEVVDELKKTGDIGFPVAAMTLVTYLKNMIQVVCMGRLGSLELAGGALAIGFTNITGYSVLSGLAMGMEPLCTQASGSRNFSLLSITLYRTILLLLLTSLPISLLWLKLEPFMLTLHQNPEISKVASLYCRYAIPDLIANSLLHPLRIYLRSKGTTWPLLWSTLLAILLHIPTITIFTFKLHLGIPGIAISSFISNFTTLLFLLLYIFFFHPCMPLPLTLSTQLLTTAAASSNHRESTGSEWGMLVRFSIQSCVGVCLEWWWYELMTLLAGYLQNPRVTLATSGIIIQTTSLMYALPTALSASGATRVGHELGRGEPGRAQLATVVAIGLALASSVVGVVWTTLGRETWGRVFTSDKQVLEMSMAVLPIIGLCEVANCPQTASCGVLRGSARPGVGAAINFWAFYVVGAPVGVVLAFGCQLGLVGLCYGLLVAQVTCVVSMMFVVYNTDWERESLRAKSMVGSDVYGDANFPAHDDDIDNRAVKCEEGAVFMIKNINED